MIIHKYENILFNKYKQITYVFINKYSMKFKNFVYMTLGKRNCENHI